MNMNEMKLGNNGRILLFLLRNGCTLCQLPKPCYLENEIHCKFSQGATLLLLAVKYYDRKVKDRTFESSVMRKRQGPSTKIRSLMSLQKRRNDVLSLIYLQNCSVCE